MYDEAAGEIRKSDPNHLVFFEGITWEIFGVAEQKGFEHVPGGAQYANKSVLSFHNSVAGGLVPDSEYYVKRQAEATRLGCGAAVTETGTGQQDLLDQHLFNYMHFDYKWYSNWTWDNPGMFLTNGYETCADRTNITACLNVNDVKQNSRVFARAVAGTIQSFQFNSTSLVGQLHFLSDVTCTAPTEVFIPTRWLYPEGVKFEVTPASAVKAELQGDVLFVTALVDKTAITVTVQPAM